MSAAAATTLSAIALMEAAQAKEAACRMTLSSYNAKTATIAEMRQYGDCVNTIYPDQLSPESVIALKVLFVVAILGFMVGAIREILNSSYMDIFEIIMGGLLWFLGAPFAVVAACLFTRGIQWLCS